MTENKKSTKGKVYPRFFQNPEGTEQIKLLNQEQQIYLRAIKQDGFYDYCASHLRLNAEREQLIEKTYVPSDHENYNALINEVTTYFHRLRAQLDKLS